MTDRKVGILALAVFSLATLGLVGFMYHTSSATPKVPEGIWTILGVSVGSIGTAITNETLKKIKGKKNEPD